jgi:hypothetical protein
MSTILVGVVTLLVGVAAFGLIGYGFVQAMQLGFWEQEVSASSRRLLFDVAARVRGEFDPGSTNLMSARNPSVRFASHGVYAELSIEFVQGSNKLHRRASLFVHLLAPNGMGWAESPERLIRAAIPAGHDVVHRVALRHGGYAVYLKSVRTHQNRVAELDAPVYDPERLAHLMSAITLAAHGAIQTPN